jgi:1-acyl-sn-glycerol-3-phosphate acyltransferase
MPCEELLHYDDDVYRTPARAVPWLSRAFPAANFYCRFWWYVYRSSVLARRGEYDGPAWSRSSYQVLRALESVGTSVEVSGVENIRRLESPCVFIGNHMSMLETIIFPGIIQPVRDVTFVVKRSLLEYPVFCHVLGSRDPIAVSRDSPRADFQAVIKGGVERLQRGISIVVFPQTTRSHTFDPSEFNTIGVKLAQRAGVPVIPTALVTDAWGNGSWLKDIGPIDPSKTVRIAFGQPITIEGRGVEQHQQVIDFIQSKLSDWNRVTGS